MKYKLRIIRTISGVEGYFSIYWKDHVLPFVPWIGLQIADFDAGFNGVGLRIDTLVWSTTLESFVAQTKGEKVADADEYHEYLLREGWSDADLDG